MQIIWIKNLGFIQANFVEFLLLQRNALDGIVNLLIKLNFCSNWLQMDIRYNINKDEINHKDFFWSSCRLFHGIGLIWIEFAFFLCLVPFYFLNHIFFPKTHQWLFYLVLIKYNQFSFSILINAFSMWISVMNKKLTMTGKIFPENSFLWIAWWSCFGIWFWLE